jgi:hypothetical protein
MVSDIKMRHNSEILREAKEEFDIFYRKNGRKAIIAMIDNYYHIQGVYDEVTIWRAGQKYGYLRYDVTYLFTESTLEEHLNHMFENQLVKFEKSWQMKGFNPDIKPMPYTFSLINETREIYEK